MLLFAGCTQRQANNNAVPQTNNTEPPKVSSTGVVKVEVVPIELKQGSTVDSTIRLRIDQGYHINANPASDPYLKATELKLTPPEGITVNFFTYPTALTRTFPFSEKPLAVYEGETVIKVQLAGSKSLKPGTQNISGKLNVQACDDQVCYAPGTIDVTIPVTTK
jgi:hypothetical protein